MFGKAVNAAVALLGVFGTKDVDRAQRYIGVDAYICSDCVPREQIVAPGIGIDLTSTYG
jgi:hypothetical protein